MAIDTISPRSRRALLAGAVGGLAALAASAARPLAARAEGETIHVGDDIFTASSATWLKNSTTDNDVFRAQSTGKGRGLYGISQGGAGVHGKSTTDAGVRGESEWIGVVGKSQGGISIHASNDSGTAVNAVSQSGFAIQAVSGNTALFAICSGADHPSVRAAKTTATGNAILGEIKGEDSRSSAVVGETAGTGNGIRGTSAKGRGGLFQGQVAQVRLEPSKQASHPANGGKGDLFVDRSGRLWFCKGGTTWKQIA